MLMNILMILLIIASFVGIYYFVIWCLKLTGMEDE